MVNPVRNYQNKKNRPAKNRLIPRGRKFLRPKRQFEILTTSPSQTKKLAKILAREFLKTSARQALILGLIGDLGGGKTTFLQGFAQGLGIKEKILSPSFVIMKRFKINYPTIKPLNHFHYFFHIDCYRIEKAEEILNLGFKKIISNPQNIISIEWADRIWKLLPQDTLILKFEFLDQKTRKIKVNG